MWCHGIDLTQYVRIQFFAFDLNKIMSWMLEVEDNLRPFVARDPGDTVLISNNCSLKAKEGRTEKSAGILPCLLANEPMCMQIDL